MRVTPIFVAAMMMIPSCLAQTVNKTEVFPDKDVAAKLMAMVQEAKTSGSSGATLGGNASPIIKLSVRTTSGGGEIHGRWDDIFVVTGGKATLITGGTVAHAHTDKDDETKGTSVANGKAQTISKGDIVHIPAGTPHQLIIVPGEVFQTIVIKAEASR
jgi:mannose-6-phosphate isomerase-like protein (cupin superfamily)